ncbi:MAG: TIM barrel protein [archaeon]
MKYACSIEANDILDNGFDLSKYQGLNIELNFYKGFDVKHLDIRSKLNGNNIEITSVHAPTLAFSNQNLLKVLECIKGQYGTMPMALHPTKADAIKERKALDDQAEAIQKFGLQICIENFPDPSERWIHKPKDLYRLAQEFPFLGITYDFSHADEFAGPRQDLSYVADKTGIIHLSNRIIKPGEKWQLHLPYKRGDFDLDEMLINLSDIGFKGCFVLEYDKTYEAEIIADCRELMER